MADNNCVETKAEIFKWLQKVFGTDFNVEIEGNTEKGDGYLGDVVFIKAQNKKVTKHLVLKCGKKSAALREKAPIRDTFKNEIYLYDTILPTFKSFESEHAAINHPFNNVAHFYGSFVTDSMEVIVLENLKKRNFILHDRQTPVTRKHIELVMNAYGHFHAISGSMRDQKPEKFEKLTEGLIEVWHTFCNSCGLDKMLQGSIQESYELLKGELPDSVRNEWKQFGENIESSINVIGKTDCFSVITHGDCWNNNFMFKGADSNPEDVVLLDWQISSLSSPVVDLSYFLFACLAKEDYKNIEKFLKFYYKSFSQTVTKLGSDPDKLYSFVQLQKDWKRFSRFGIMMSALVIKIAMTDKEDCKGLEETIHEGGEFADSFKPKIKNERAYMLRMKEMVQYAVDNQLITSLQCCLK